MNEQKLLDELLIAMSMCLNGDSIEALEVLSKVYQRVKSVQTTNQNSGDKA